MNKNTITTGSTELANEGQTLLVQSSRAIIYVTPEYYENHPYAFMTGYDFSDDDLIGLA